MSQFMRQIIIITLTAIFISGSFFVSPIQASQEQTSLKNYLAYFYNRYSKHLDDWGLVYKAPAYNVPQFRPAQTAREILSLASYYKYRALQGDRQARQIIRQAILDADTEMNVRDYNTQSFSDAWTQMTIVSLLDQVPFLLDQGELDIIYDNILARMESGIMAPDSSNRATLSAVYWQQVVNSFYQKEFIELERKIQLDQLIYQKIKSVVDNNIDQAGWYQEGTPMKFNPHYHMVTAFALASYAEITGSFEVYFLAKKMTQNLRDITFQNGMVEARIGARPVGLGAQFYLGTGLLNYKFGFDDFAVYFNYAAGDRFFSDPEYDNRLEYHSTVYGTNPNYHDDISFSNLAELALLTPSMRNISFSPADQINRLNNDIESGDIVISHQDNVIYFNHLKITQTKDGSSTHLYNTLAQISRDQQVKGVSAINISQTYGQARLSSEQETEMINQFYRKLAIYFYGGIIPISAQSFNTLSAAYIYGSYTIDEIADTILNGPAAVHPSIPAHLWRSSSNYQIYLNHTP